MATRTVHIDPGPWRAWQKALNRFPGDFADEVEDEWHHATDFFFDRTQQAVHIITGALKQSGDSSVTRTAPHEVTGEVAYGNEGPEGVVYAQYEMDRGGDHAFLDIGWVASEREYRDALDRAFNRVMDRRR